MFFIDGLKEALKPVEGSRMNKRNLFDTLF